MTSLGERQGVIAIVTAIALFAWVGALPCAAASPPTKTYVLIPSGGDDTEAIRGAFEGCGSTPGCTIQLGAGTFHTAQVIVHDFHGVFRGKGVQETIVEALPNMPVSDLVPFYVYPSTYEDPWPMFFDFYDGAYAISDMTFSVPSPTPTEPWWDENTNAYIRSLNSIVEINGVDVAASITRIAVVGGPGEMNGLNTYIGFVVQGFTHRPGAPLPYDMFPLRISLELTNSLFSMIAGGGIAGLVDSMLTIRGNTFMNIPSSFAFLIDSSRSVAEVSHNVFDGQGVFAGQGLAFVPPWAPLACWEPSRVVIANNDIRLAAGATGIQALDLGELYGCERSLDLVVSNNVIRGDPESGMGVFSMMARSAVVTGNEISVAQQGVYFLATPGVVAHNEIRDSLAAVALDTSADVLVAHNEIRGGQYGISLSQTSNSVISHNEPSRCTVWGISLEAGSSDNAITYNDVRHSGAFDLYWDETGTGNVWTKNEYRTSSPPDL